MAEPSFNKQIGILSIGRFWAYLIRFITPVILVRLISKEEFGIYQQFLTFTWFFPQFLMLGLDNAPYYFFPRLEGNANRSRFLNTNWLIIIFVLLIVCPFLYIFYDPLISLWKDSQVLSGFRSVAILYIVFMILATNLENIFVIEKKMRMLLLYLVVNSILRVVIILVTFFIYRTLNSIFYSLMVFEIIRTIFYALYIIKNYQTDSNSLFDRAMAREMLKYSLPLGYGVAIGNIARNIEKYLLPVFINARDYAVYSVANFRIPYIAVLLNSINNVTIIELTRIAESKNWLAVKDLWHSIIVKQMLFILPSITFFFIAADQIITVLFTANFNEAVPIFRILLFTFIPHTISPHVILRATGYTKKLGIIDLITFAVSVPGAYFLIKQFGLTGGVVAPVFVYFVNFIMQNYVAVNIIETRFSEMWPYKRILKVLISCIFAGTLQFLLNSFVLNEFNVFIRLIVESLFFVIIYFICVHFLRLYNVRWILSKVLGQLSLISKVKKRTK